MAARFDRMRDRTEIERAIDRDCERGISLQTAQIALRSKCIQVREVHTLERTISTWYWFELS
jgi:hypothetical protein